MNQNMKAGDLTKTLFACGFWEEIPKNMSDVFTKSSTILRDSLVFVLDGEVMVTEPLCTTPHKFLRVMTWRGLGWVNREFLWDEMP